MVGINNSIEGSKNLLIAIRSELNWIFGPEGLSHMVQSVQNLVVRYKEWWFRLLTNDPTHVLVETCLLLFLVYMILGRRKSDWREKMKEKLTEEEREELLRDWKESFRAPLAPSIDGTSQHGRSFKASDAESAKTRRKIGTGIVVEKVLGSKLVIRDGNNDNENKQNEDKNDNFETDNVISNKDTTTETNKKTPKQSNESDKKKPSNSTTSSPATKTVLNFATHDFIGASSTTNTSSSSNPNNTSTNSPEYSTSTNVIKEASRQALDEYGCGSCGPRGFYGTIDAHLDLEDDFANFFHTEGAILYSDGSAAVSSTIAAFAKRGDLLLVDEGVCEAIGTGVTLSRANVKYFKHNDMEDLRRVLERVRATDQTLNRRSNDQRRFIVVEGLYKNHGTICPLDKLMALKEEFCYRLIIDESHSFGALGAHGRGALEHYNKHAMMDAEIVILGLENALGSIGGITVGNNEVVDHQRLSGAGYCFSASNPPFLARAASASLKRMIDQPIHLTTLRNNVTYFYTQLQQKMSSTTIKSKSQTSCTLSEKLLITSMKNLSPIVFIKLVQEEPMKETKTSTTTTKGKNGSKGKNSSHNSNSKKSTILNLTAKQSAEQIREDQIQFLDKVAESCLQKGLAIISTGGHIHHHLTKIPSPALRLTVMSQQSQEDLDTAIQILIDVLREAFME